MPESHLSMDDNRTIDELIASMTRELACRELLYCRSHGNIDDSGPRCRLIYKVMERIRASDPNSYEPRVLSIGPYHYGIPSLLPMEKEKWLCLDYVLKLNRSRGLRDYLAVTSALEREARMCFAEDDIIGGRTFVEILLLDACFILVCLNGIGGIRVKADIHERYCQEQSALTEIVIGQHESLSSTTNEDIVQLQVEQNQYDAHGRSKQGNNDSEPYHGQNHDNLEPGEQWCNSSAVYDLLLLENQIPFFVVSEIYELLVGDQTTTDRLLTDKLARFIEGILLHLPLSIQSTNRPKDFDHLLHLCYIYLKPSRHMQHNCHVKKKTGYIHNILYWGFKYLCSTIGSHENDNKNPLMRRWRRAEEYHEAGVEFTERIFDEDDPHSLLDIEFRDGILHIPCLPIDDRSGTLFRNLLAFEQTCPSVGNDLASYVCFMSQLISVPDDVALLSRKGVIVHQLDSDEEVSSLFTKLFESVAFDFSGEHYLKSLCHTMEAHYQSRVNRWMSWLWHKHFGNPWLGFTALASVVMIFCSIGQTVLAFLSYMSTS
ncbi:hypothetical protein BS78_07G036300 [Paspalum vaginatum]|nr:hypothetical protein BS78_07G036300 [Paspalum vaginatum]